MAKIVFVSEMQLLFKRIFSNKYPDFFGASESDLYQFLEIQRKRAIPFLAYGH